LEHNDQLPPDKKGTVKTKAGEHSWNVWGEWLSPFNDTETLATYADQFYAETPAVISRKLRKGTVTYLGAWSEMGSLEKEILRHVYQKAGAEILNLPEYVFVEWRNGYWVGVNYTSETASLPIPENAQLIFGEREIQPGGVSVCME